MVKTKLTEKASQLISLIKHMSHYYEQRLEEITHVLEAENELAKMSNMEFVCAIRPMLKELSYMEIEPFSDVYKRYIDKVMWNISEGRELPDILNIYDTKLLKMRGSGK